MTNPSPSLKKLTGVEYTLPDLRPRCLTIAKPGAQPATSRLSGLVTNLLKCATDFGMGMVQSLPNGESEGNNRQFPPVITLGFGFLGLEGVAAAESQEENPDSDGGG